VITAVQQHGTRYNASACRASSTTRQAKSKAFRTFWRSGNKLPKTEMKERLYFDWNASALLRPEAAEKLAAAMKLTGNASSVHREGRVTRALIENARGQVAQLVGAEAKNVSFTSGATEANMLALTPAIVRAGEKGLRGKLLVSAIEHPSVLRGGRFAPDMVEILPVTAQGIVDVEALRRAIARAERPLISVMLANNETGVVQPVAEIAELVHAAGGILHVDAVQGPGRIDCTMERLGADMLTLSSHKLGGPLGAGALVVRDGFHITDPLITGGGQERGLRAGTENVAAIAGFGAACAAVAAARETESAHMLDLRARLERGLKAITPQAFIFGESAPRLPNTTLFACSGMKAETAIIAFDLNGVAASSGSACSSGKVTGSHVLAAMGVASDLARGAVRFSLGATTTQAEVEQFLQTWKMLAGSLLKEKRGIAA
jgi:cysteine desulfurase